MLQLIKPSKEQYHLLKDMLDEWTVFNTNDSPASIFRIPYSDMDLYLKNLDREDDPQKDIVKDTTLFLYDDEATIFVGAVNIRYKLNDYLSKFGGHIGYGIRPSCRRKSYATKLLGLALEKCKELHLNEVLLVCNKDNLASKKVIQNNNGLFLKEIVLNKENINTSMLQFIIKLN